MILTQKSAFKMLKGVKELCLLVLIIIKIIIKTTKLCNKQS